MKITITYKYSPKKYVNMGAVALYCVGLLLTVGRWWSAINNDFVVFNAETYSHMSNFSLSMLVYLSIGYMWLLFGVKFRFIVVLGAFLIIANFACEILMGFMNTPDIIDAIYGTVGIVVIFVFLFFTNKYGLVPENEEKS